MAEIALECVAIPARVTRNQLGVLFFVPSQLLVGNGSSSVPLIDALVDGLPIQVTCCWAGASFEVMCHAARSSMSLPDISTGTSNSNTNLPLTLLQKGQVILFAI